MKLLKMLPQMTAALVAAFVGVGAAHAQEAACVVYEHARFKGDRLALREGQGYSKLIRWNDRISSVRVERGCSLRVARDKNFKSTEGVFTESARYVGDKWNDSISSLSCSCSQSYRRPPPVRYDDKPDRSRRRAACTVFEGGGFSGESLDMNPGQEYARLRRWNDRVASVKVRRGCELRVAEHWNFGGSGGTISDDASDVGRSWRRRISSMSCQCDNGRGGRDDAFRPKDKDRPPRLSRDGAACIVYRDSGFSGAWRAFERGDENETLGRRLDEAISSVQVAPGCVALLDVGLPYKLWLEQDVRRLGRSANDRTSSVSCFCPRRWR